MISSKTTAANLQPETKHISNQNTGDPGNNLDCFYLDKTMFIRTCCHLLSGGGTRLCLLGPVVIYCLVVDKTMFIGTCCHLLFGGGQDYVY